MFSQLRNVVENIAQQSQQTSPSRSLSGSFNSNDTQRRSGSFDLSNTSRSVALSTEQLAESALSNLRKSFASQRQGSPTPSPPADGIKSPLNKASGTKVNLEDRLRARLSPELFLIGTPTPASRPSSPNNAIASITNIGNYPSSVSLNALPSLPNSKEEYVNAQLSACTFSQPGGLQFDESLLMDRLPEADIPLPPSPIVEPIEMQEIFSGDISSSIEVGLVTAETLQRKLKEVEGRLFDVSESYRRLQTERNAIDDVLRDFTGLDAVNDIPSLQRTLLKSRSRLEAQNENLNSLLPGYADKLEEPHNFQSQESQFHLNEVDELRKRLKSAEASLKAVCDDKTRLDEENKAQKNELDQKHEEMKKSAAIAREEEEKRTKAVSLLKTVRQKLVRAEKEREDAFREIVEFKEKEKIQKETEMEERLTLEHELEALRQERLREIAELKVRFELDLASTQENLERDFSSRSARIETELDSIRLTYQSEMASNAARISELEASLQALNDEKGNIFDQLQMRQAEVESLQSHAESLQSSKDELRFQLRNALERIGLMAEELTELHSRELQQDRRSPPIKAGSFTASVVEMKYEAKLNELTAKLSKIESERSETEGILSKNLELKVSENEKLKILVESMRKELSSTRNSVKDLRESLQRVVDDAATQRGKLDEALRTNKELQEAESLAHLQQAKLKEQLLFTDRELRNAVEREAQAKSHNKIIRDELRKVQASVALLENQRKPGIAYRIQSSDSEKNSTSNSTSQPVLSESTNETNQEGDINLQYLRNIILQFLEHKDMRPQLIQVLSIILQFTPQETRRLISKTRTA